MSTKLSILVVDDDEVTRKLLKEVLDKEGYHVTLAASGEEAVRALRDQVFPIVLSDIRMLELDGMAVLRSVKKSNVDTAVILMTGFGSMEGAIVRPSIGSPSIRRRHGANQKRPIRWMSRLEELSENPRESLKFTKLSRARRCRAARC
jgi:CheY-like chemotaxis protein